MHRPRAVRQVESQEREGRIAEGIQRFYRPELDVLRAVAMAMVFYSHLSAPMMGARSSLLAEAAAGGLSLFFLLSAFLISELLHLEQQRTGAIHLRDFYLRRILRVWPLYLLMLGLNLLAGPWIRPYNLTTGATLAMLGMAANFYIAYRGPMRAFVFPLWSISLEEQFYLLVPTTWKWLGERGAAVLGWMTLPLAYGFLLWAGAHHLPDRQVFYSSLVQFQYFGLGIVLAGLLRGRTLRLPGVARVGIVAAAFALMAASALGLHLRAQARPVATPLGYLLLTAGTVLLLLGFLHWERLARAKALIYLGRISYGMLCFHIPAGYLVLHFEHAALVRLGDRHPGAALAVQVASFLLAFLVTIAVAAVSYRFFETPFLQLKKRFTYVPSGQPLPAGKPAQAAVASGPSLRVG